MIVWLGSEDGDSTFAILSLRGLGSSFALDEVTKRVSTPRGEYTESILHWYDRKASLRDRQAVANLLERPWWHRVWIRQEVFFADEDTSIVVCGSAWLFLADMRRAIHWITTIGLGNPRHNDLLSQAYSVCLRTASTEPILLSRLRSSDCGDPRDRVYGILGILQATNGGRPVNIGYGVSNTVEILYKEVMVQHMSQYATLLMLEHAGLWQDSEMRPTWVPDWRERGEEAVSLHSENASSHFDSSECKTLDAGVLRDLGCCAGRVSKVHVLEPAKSEEQSELESWRELAILLFDGSDSVAARVAIERASNVLCSILPEMPAVRPQMEGITAEIKKYVTHLYAETPQLKEDHRHLPKLPIEIISYGASIILTGCVETLRSRSAPLLFVPNGYFGLGPTGVKLNDEIWAVLGSRALIVLRKAFNRNNYEVVGPCSIHGFNFGGAILGPLPEQYMVFSHFDNIEGFKELQYLNTTTGKASRWDPRIAWAELEAHPPMSDLSLDWPPDGEPPRVRPGSEYLRRHNVEVQHISLV